MIKRAYNRARTTIRASYDGTCNNGLNYGTFTTNLNNAFSNANWNNDAALAYSNNIFNAVVCPREAKINSIIGSLVGVLQNASERG